MRWACSIRSMISHLDGIGTGSMWLAHWPPLKPALSALTTPSMGLRTAPAPVVSMAQEPVSSFFLRMGFSPWCRVQVRSSIMMP